MSVCQMLRDGNREVFLYTYILRAVGWQDGSAGLGFLVFFSLMLIYNRISDVHCNTRQDMKKHEWQVLQISASLVVETVLISMKIGNWLVAYV